MIQRIIAESIRESLEKFPVVAVTGPRQSGKTTLSRMLMPHYTYVNLEDLEKREFALEDPKGFLETYKGGVIIDEIQNAPGLFSYLQVYTDERRQNGEYLITGSQNFLMLEKISQSLAGRVAIHNLLPFSMDELKSGGFDFTDREDYLLYGSYPRKWMQEIDASDFYSNYVKTYVERDVRQIKNIKDLNTFQNFVRLLAGRTGQLFNQSNIGNTLGIDNKTVNSWMNLLEASFIAFRLRPYHKNFNKRLVKTPKIYFYDTGLAAYLLGIRNKNDFQVHFAQGQLFENFIILERIKNALNLKSREEFYFWRDQKGTEIDLLIEDGPVLKAVEIKYAKTLQTAFFKNLNKFKESATKSELYLIYGGSENIIRNGVTVRGFHHLNEV